MTEYRNDFARCIQENIERGDKAYAHAIECWEKHIEFTVRAAIEAGFSIGVNNGEDTVLTHCVDVEMIMRALFSTDEDYLFFYQGKDLNTFAWVWLIYGNGPDEVISDYSSKLEPLFMDKVNKFADSLI